MPIKPLDRLLFAQGGRCFFCGLALTKENASVEHLVAVANGGSDSDENCVACCEQLNKLLGRMSLKEKLRIVLNQKGNFVCPAAAKTIPAPKPVAVKHATGMELKIQSVLTDLRKRGAAKPGTVPKLKNSMKTALKNGESDAELDALVQALRSAGHLVLDGTKVSYRLDKVKK